MPCESLGGAIESAIASESSLASHRARYGTQARHLPVQRPRAPVVGVELLNGNSSRWSASEQSTVAPSGHGDGRAGATNGASWRVTVITARARRDRSASADIGAHARRTPFPLSLGPDPTALSCHPFCLATQSGYDELGGDSDSRCCCCCCSRRISRRVRLASARSRRSSWR